MAESSAVCKAGRSPTTKLPRNVWSLGWVSFFNDTATEMSYWLLPQFLAGVLKAGTVPFGIIEGTAETAASLSRLVSGFLSDRLRRRKTLMALGYTVANVTKPLLAVGQTWGQVFWIRFADRAAKGFRAAPRDALLADSVSSAERGSAFGLRQAMDSAGAIAGPLLAILFLPLFWGNVRSIFWLATVPGAISILLAWFVVREVPPPAPLRSGVVRKGIGQLRNRRLAFILAAVGIFSLGNSSDLFLVLRAQNVGLSPMFAPLLGLVFNAVYTLLSWPAGKVSDRLPRRSLVVGGYLIYAAVYFGFARVASPTMVWGLFALYGVYYALTEGVIRAWISDLIPSESRASAYGVFSWVVGLSALPASVLAGWLWQHYSPAAPFQVSAALSCLAAMLLLLA